MQRCDLRQLIGHEALSAEAGFDRHDQSQIQQRQIRNEHTFRRFRLDGEADLLAMCFHVLDRGKHILRFVRLDVKHDQIRTGTILDAETTAELLKNIFYPKAPLHDGAAIIRSGRIQAAGCMLPLSNNPNLSKELGMRHRAGIGMSEASDAVVVIVSEETGAISVAVNGMLKRHLTKDTFEKILRNELIPEVKEEPTGAFRFLRRKEKDKADE